MPSNVALTAGELASLNNSVHDAPYYLSFHADNVVATATVATTPTGAYVLQIAVNSTVNWTKIREGMTALITNAAGTVRRGYYRVRNGGNAGFLLIEQIAFADPGSIANNNRTDIIQAGDAISIIERFDLYSMKPLTIGTTINQDGTIAVGTRNQTPEVIVNMTINSNPGDYITMLATNGATQHITATVTVNKWPTSAGSTLSYAWITPASWTNITGSATATLGADVPSGDYIVYCQVTDSIASVTQEVCRWVRIHSPADPPLAVNVTADDETRQGRKMTVRFVQGTISAIPPGAKCCITGPYTWGGSDVATANHTFIGYLYNQPFAHEPGYYESHADIWGVGAILDTLIGAPVTLKYASTPVTWEQVATSLSTVQFAAWFVARWRVANLLKCFNFTLYSMSGTIGRRQNIPIPQGTVYSQLKALADMYDANVGSRPDGEIIVQRLPSILQDRSGVATRCTLNNSIYSNVEVTWKRRNEYGDVFHGGVYISDSSLTSDVQVQGEAPGLQSFGQGGKTDRKTGKVYETQVDNIIRVGYWQQLLNNEYPQIKVDIPNNWDVFCMADLNRIVVNVPPDKSPTGLAISITCIPVSMSKKWIPGRRASITLMLEGETTSTAGENVPIPPQIVPTPAPVNPIRALPLTPLLTPVPDVGGTVTPTPPTLTPGKLKIPINGDVVAASGAANVWITPDFISKTNPDWNNITPGSLAGTAGTFAPAQVVFDPIGAAAGTAIGLYALTVDTHGTQTQIQYTPIAALVTPAWTPGTILPALYNVMRATLAQAGGVFVYEANTGSDVLLYDYDFTVSNGGFTTTPNDVHGNPPGIYVAGQGWKVGDYDDNSGPNSWERLANIVSPSYASLTFSRIVMTYNIVTQGAYTTGVFHDQVFVNGAGPNSPVVTPTASGITVITLPGPLVATTSVSGYIHTSRQNSQGALTGVGYITRIQIYGTGPGGLPNVQYSSNYGASFGGSLTFGGTAGGGGFDVQRNGGISVAGGYGTLYQATTLGGAYSARNSFGSASPSAAIIPFYAYNSTTQLQIAAGSVDVLVGLDSGTMSLCWALASGGTIDISPASGAYPASPDAITCAYGRWISYLSSGGTLYESNNAGGTWTAISAFSGGSADRVRRNDVSWLTNRGQLYALDNAGRINFTSHVVTHGALYPRTPPGIINRFDVYP